MKYDDPAFSRFFPVSAKNFQNVLILQQVIIPRHSIGFQCNLVHEQTTLSSTSCSQQICNLFHSFLHKSGLSKNGILQIT